MMKKDRCIGVVSLMLGIIFLVLATQIPMPDSSATTGEPGPRVFPYISGFLLVISGLGLLIQKQRDSEKYLEKGQWIRLGFLLLLFILYCAGIRYLGFMISTPVMLWITMTMFAGERKLSLKTRLLYSVGVTLVIWVLFAKILNTAIPQGILKGIL